MALCRILKYWASPTRAQIKLGYKYNKIKGVIDTNKILDGYKWRKMTIEELCI